MAGIDGTPDGQQFIKNGRMVLTIFQDAKGQATGAVQVTKALLNKQKVETLNWVPYKLITPENYLNFVAENSKYSHVQGYLRSSPSGESDQLGCLNNDEHARVFWTANGEMGN